MSAFFENFKFLDSISARCIIPSFVKKLFWLDSKYTLDNEKYPKGIPITQLTATISEPEISRDTLFMADGSNYTPYFKNQGYPTNLNCFAYVVSIDVIHPAVPDGRDTIQTIEEGLNSPAEEGPGAADSIRSLENINQPIHIK